MASENSWITLSKTGFFSVQWIFFCLFILQRVMIDMLLVSVKRGILWVFAFNTLYLSLYLWGNSTLLCIQLAFILEGHNYLTFQTNKGSWNISESYRNNLCNSLTDFSCSLEAQKLKFGNQSCMNTDIFLKSSVQEFLARGLVKSKALKFLKVLKGHKKLITMIQAQE